MSTMADMMIITDIATEVVETQATMNLRWHHRTAGCAPVLEQKFFIVTHSSVAPQTCVEEWRPVPVFVPEDSYV